MLHTFSYFDKDLCVVIDKTLMHKMLGKSRLLLCGQLK